MITELQRTVVCQIADIARTPCLMVPVCSASRPMRVLVCLEAERSLREGREIPLA